MNARRLAITAAAGLALGVALAWVFMRIDDRHRSTPAGRQRYERVIALAPSIAEIVFELGQGARVAGVSRWTEWPPEAADKPEVGGWADVNFELLSRLAPDLIIIQGRHQKVRDYARRRGIDLLPVDMQDLDTIYEGIASIARALDCPEEGEALALRIVGKLARAGELAAGRRRPRVLVTVSRRTGSLDSLASAGKNDFLSEVIEIAGGRNIFDDCEMRWPVVSNESVLARRPEVIIEAAPGETFTSEELALRRNDWDSLRALPAVRTGRIHTITASYALIPGPRVGELALAIADILHGENTR